VSAVLRTSFFDSSRSKSAVMEPPTGPVYLGNVSVQMTPLRSNYNPKQAIFMSNSDMLEA
jgi:hypothetical protein